MNELVRTDKLTLVVIKNPFDPKDRTIKQVAIIPGEPVFNYTIAELMLPVEEITICHNGQIVEDSEYHTLKPLPGDFIIIMPKVGKGDALRVIATIVVMYFAWWAGSAVTTALTTAGYGASAAFWGSVASTAASYIGGKLLNQWGLGSSSNESSSTTYNWSGVSSTTGQGNAISLTYGTVKTGGQLLISHVSSSGDDQYLNLLYCGGEGALDEVDGITDLRINDNPIENFIDTDDSDCIQWEYRIGTNEQTKLTLSGFNETYTDTSLNYELEVGEAWENAPTQLLEGNLTQGIECTFSLPYGLYHINSDGDYKKTSVSVQVQYRLISSGDWTDYTWSTTYQHTVKYYSLSGFRSQTRFLINIGQTVNIFTTKYGVLSAVVAEITDWGGDTGYAYMVSIDGPDDAMLSVYAVRYTSTYTALDITSKKTSAIIRTIRFDNIPIGQYEVRVRCASKSGSGTNYSNRIYWAQVTSIIYASFVRPNKILVAIKALATDKLNGSNPTITWKQTRSIVYVWNPSTLAYEQKAATNPAWACYDLLHRCRKLYNINTSAYEYIVKNIPYSRIDYASFKIWADFCDELVGGETRYTVNYIIDTVQNLWDALVPFETVGWGKVFVKGTKYSCVCDAPITEYVQMFNVSNIALDSFTETFVDFADRANAVEVTFYNKYKDYDADTICIYSDDYNDADTVQNPVQITLYGCDNYKQAYRHGFKSLKVNKYINRTCEISVDIDALACTLGDGILIQHDVPRWGNGGRVVSATINTVTLDKAVVMVPGNTYQIAIQLSITDDLVIKTVSNIDVTGTILTVSSNYDTIPSQYDKWQFGKTDVYAKPFRVNSITRDGDLRRKITGLEYIEAVYTDATTIPVIDYTVDTPAITNLSVNEHADASFQIWLDISWQPSRGSYGGAKVLLDGKQIAKVDMSTTSYSYQVATEATYNIKVSGIDYFGNDLAPVSISYTVIGFSAPADIVNLRDYILTNKTWLTWDKIDDYRAIQYEIRKGTTWNNGQYLDTISDNNFKTQGNGTYWVAGYWHALYSTNPSSIVETEADLTLNILETYNEADTGWSGTCSGGATVANYGGDSVIQLVGSGDLFNVTDLFAIEDLFYYGGVSLEGIYTIPTSHIVDIGISQLCNVYADLVSFGDSIVELFDSDDAFDSEIDFDGSYGNYISVKIQIQTALDDEVFGEWKDFIAGQFVARKFNFRLLLTSTSTTITAIALDFSFTVDMPEVIDYNAYTTTTTAYDVTFTKSFNIIPYVTIGIINGATGDYYTISNKTKIGFTIQFFNSVGTGIARNFEYHATGY